MNNFIRESVKTGIWFIFFLVLFDVIANFLFPYPSDPRQTSVGNLNQYFDYGRSIEDKILRKVGETNETTDELALAGWIDPQQWQRRSLPTRPESEANLLMATYGMSFSNDVSQEVANLQSDITLRLIAGPASPANHSFAAYKADRDNHEADIVMLGILASSVKGMAAMSNMTWGFEVPAPVTYPRYIVEAGELQKIAPKISSIEQLRNAKENSGKWQAFVSQLQEYDRFFDPFMFEHNILDRSALVRLLRRSYGQAHQRRVESQIYTPAGFNTESEEIQALKIMVQQFAATAREDGRLPIVLLLNDQGYQDHLFQVLEPILAEHDIPYVSTHTIAPATDASNFIGDGHFTKAANRDIAQEVLDVIHQHFEAK